MPAHKGHAKAGGRKKGTPNKSTASAKEAVALAFEGIGGVGRLTAWADENPGEFYKHYARLIPLDVTSGGEKIAAPVVTFAGTPDA